MSIPALAFAALMAAPPTNPVKMPPAVPVTLVAPAAVDQELPASPSGPAVASEPALPPAASVPEEPLPPVAAAELLAPTTAAPASGSDIDEIVVTAQRHTTRGDPLEKVNAKTFEATEAVDRAFVGPVARAYAHTVPKPVRNGLRNFLNNLDEPVALLNFLLQLKPGKAVETLGRFAINSTIGLAGVLDVAKRHLFNLPRRSIGFADTLGYYGVKSGPFLFLPLIGPTTLRDLLGGGIDGFVLPSAFGKPFNRLTFTVPTTVLREFDSRNEFDEQLNALRKTADPYAARRELYLKKRRDQIDELRGKGRDAQGPASRLIDPGVDPITPPVVQDMVPAAASQPEATTLPGVSGSTPSDQTLGSGAQVPEALDRPALQPDAEPKFGVPQACTSDPGSVGVLAFRNVFKDFPGRGIDADLEGLAPAADVEGVAQAAAATFLFQLPVGDLSRMGLERDRLRLRHRDAGGGREFLADIGVRLGGESGGTCHR